MKAMKKLFSLLLVLTLVLGMALPAAAAGENGTFTVTNTVADHDYKLYKLLDLSFDPGDTDAEEDDKYAWSIDPASPWLAFLEGPTGQQFVTITEVVDPVDGTTSYVVAGKDGGSVMTAVDFALAAIKWVKAYEADATTGHGKEGHNCLVLQTETSAVSGSSVVFEGLDYGYYLVDSSVGAYGILQPLSENISVADKNDPPTPVKEVLGTSATNLTGTWGKENDTWYGQPVEFHIDFQKKHGAQNYAVHDDMDDNLILDPTSIKVYTITKNPDGTVTKNAELVVGTMDADGNVSEGADYALRFPDSTVPCDLDIHDPSNTMNCDFEVRFKNSYMQGLTDGQWVRVAYTATLSSDAPVDTALPNTTVMTYGDKGISVYDETETYTHLLRVLKFESGTGDEKIPLAGATFRLLSYTNENPIGLVYLGEQDIITVDGHQAMVPTYRVATAAELAAAEAVDAEQGQAEGAATPVEVVFEFTTSDSGRINIQGLDAGVFYLQETEAPQGYNLLDDWIAVYISGLGDATQVRYMYKEDFDAQKATLGTDFANYQGWATQPGKRVAVENKTGAKLPETGGMGTTVLYVVGTIMVLGAAILLITKRRMTAR